MKNLLLLAFAALFLTGCEILAPNDGTREREPQRMVCMVLRFKTDDPKEQQRNILITTNLGQFNSVINRRDPEAPDGGVSQLIVTGRVFDIAPGAVRLDINVKLSGTLREVNFEQSVTPVPGQGLLLHHEGLQSFFLTVFVLPGAKDPEREEILRLSPAGEVQKILNRLAEERKPPTLPGSDSSSSKEGNDDGEPETPKTSKKTGSDDTPSGD